MANSVDPLREAAPKRMDSVRAYTDFRRFLRDFYTDQKARTSRFSFRAFARAA
jgi:hypothetical protein